MRRQKSQLDSPARGSAVSEWRVRRGLGHSGPRAEGHSPDLGHRAEFEGTDVAAWASSHRPGPGSVLRPMAGPGTFCLLRELSQPPPCPKEQSTCLRSSQVSSCPLPPRSHACPRPPPGTHTVFVPVITCHLSLAPITAGTLKSLRFFLMPDGQLAPNTVI